jgi:glycosyltransferase involved in cell wall biosynthesis
LRPRLRLRRGPRRAGPSRVAYLHDGQTFGGIETLQVNVVRRLDRERFDPSVVLFDTGDAAGQFRDVLSTEQVDVGTVDRRGGRSLVSSAAMVWRLQQLLRRDRVDVTHIQTRGPGASRLLTVAAWIAGVPARVRTEHTPELDPGRWGRYKLVPFDLLTDLIVSDSQADREHHVSTLHRPPSKVVTSYCGIDPFPFDPDHDVAAAKASLGIPPATTVVGTVGRMHAQKGHTYLLSAAAALLERRDEPLLFLIVGDGPDEDSLRKQAEEAGITDRVWFAGFQAEPLAFMQAMDVVVMPSLWEGFSISMQEFMALGKAMVVSDHHSFREAIDDGVHGLIVERADAAGLADAIERLLQDPPMRALLGKAAAERARADFSIDRHVEELMALYGELLERRTPASSRDGG